MLSFQICENGFKSGAIFSIRSLEPIRTDVILNYKNYETTISNVEVNSRFIWVKNRFNNTF